MDSPDHEVHSWSNIFYFCNATIKINYYVIKTNWYGQKIKNIPGTERRPNNFVQNDVLGQVRLSKGLNIPVGFDSTGLELELKIAISLCYFFLMRVGKLNLRLNFMFFQ